MSDFVTGGENKCWKPRKIVGKARCSGKAGAEGTTIQLRAPEKIFSPYRNHRDVQRK